LILTISSDKTALLWDATSGKLLRSLQRYRGTIHSASFSPDGRLILIVNDLTISLFDVLTGRELRELKGHNEHINEAVFSPDGKLVLSAGADNVARIFEVASGNIVRELMDYRSDVTSAVFSPDGKMFLTATYDSIVHIYSSISGVEKMELRAPFLRRKKCSYISNGKYILIESEYELKMYDAFSGKELSNIDIGFSWENYSLNPKGLQVLVKDDLWSANDTSRIFDLLTGNEEYIIAGSMQEPGVFSPDGTTLLYWEAASSNTGGEDFYWRAHLYDAKRGIEIRQMNYYDDPLESVVFCPDGKNILTTGYGDMVRICEVSTGKELRKLRGFTNKVSYAAFSPDGGQIALAVSDSMAYIYDSQSANVLKSLNFDPGWSEVLSITYSRDGKGALVTFYDDFPPPEIFDLATGSKLQVASLFNSLTWEDRIVAISADSLIAIVQREDSSIFACHAISGKKLQEFSGEKFRVKQAAFSEDCKLVLLQGVDNLVHIYDIGSGKELQLLGEEYMGQPGCKCGCHL
jgi:WD40 repeat protein